MFLLLILLAVTLYLLCALFTNKNIGFERKEKDIPFSFRGISAKAKKPQALEPAPAASLTQKDFLPAEEGQNNAQRLKKVKEEYKKAQEELQSARADENAARGELEKLKASLNRDSDEAEKLKRESRELKERLTAKDTEYDKEIALNIALSREINEYKQKASSLEELKRNNEERIRLLESQNSVYKEENKKITRENENLKEKDQHSQWVSKKEYEELLAKLKEKENA